MAEAWADDSPSEPGRSYEIDGITLVESLEDVLLLRLQRHVGEARKKLSDDEVEAIRMLGI